MTQSAPLTSTILDQIWLDSNNRMLNRILNMTLPDHSYQNQMTQLRFCSFQLQSYNLQLLTDHYSFLQILTVVYNVLQLRLINVYSSLQLTI